MIEHEDNTPEQKKEFAHQRETAKRRKDRVDLAWKTVMATPAGRAVMWDHLASLGILATPAVWGANDRTYANIGRHNAALELWHRLQNDFPADFLRMQQENM